MTKKRQALDAGWRCKCGAPIPKQKGRGRARQWCSNQCRSLDRQMSQYSYVMQTLAAARRQQERKVP